MNPQTLQPKFTQNIYISQVSMSPESVAGKSFELQNAMNWGLKVSGFIISLYMLASIVRYILDISRK